MQSARRVQSEEVRGHLHNAHHRVMSIAAVQKQLAASEGGTVALRAYLQQLCDSLGASMIADKDRLCITVAVDDSVTPEWAAAHVQKDGCVQGNLASRHMVTGGDDLVRVKGVIRTPAGRLLLQTVRKVVQSPEILPETGDPAQDRSARDAVARSTLPGRCACAPRPREWRPSCADRRCQL